MDHHPIQWGYTSTPTQQNTWIPPQPVKKRTISDSECDDVYSEESSKEHYDLVSPERSSNGESDSCQLLSRKRRRGVIEKKRRDKINSSLSELKRLVPTAYEKQGSAKLEKAEILQLTVDHLKGLHSKGIDSMSIDSQRYALEYNIIGLRECAAEVSRYLVTIEGMDIQDPLRLRLMSHLQCFVAQRELSAKNSTSSGSWVPSSYQSVPGSSAAYGPSLPPPPPPPSTSASTSSSYHQHYIPLQTSTSLASPNSYNPAIPVSPTHHQQQQQQQHCNTSVPLSTTTTTNTTTLLQSGQVPSTSQHHHHPHHHHPSSQYHHNLHHDPYNQYPITHDTQQGSIYADLSSSRGPLTSLGYPQYPPHTPPQGYPPHGGTLAVGSYNGNTMKPYRPWGAEMAY